MQVSEFKFVQKIYVIRQGKRFLSSCTFIGPYTAITAAHSVDGFDRVSGKDDAEATQVVIHPEYSPAQSNFLNDIAVVKFKTPFAHFCSIGQKLFESKDYYRVGFGGRDGKNDRSTFKIKLNGIYERHLEFEDSNSIVGDSGGGVFNDEFELIGSHSTKENSKIYTTKISYYQNWLTPYIDRSRSYQPHSE